MVAVANRERGMVMNEVMTAGMVVLCAVAMFIGGLAVACWMQNDWPRKENEGSVMQYRSLLNRISATIATVFPSKAGPCKLFGQHLFEFQRNEPGPMAANGVQWWWEYEKCKCGEGIRMLVAGQYVGL